MNWFELGGQVFDQTSELSRLGGQWYDPAIGHNLTENGRGIGLNPYPVAENSTPNELPPSYNGSVDTGLNGLERALGRVWLAGQSGTNVVSGASFALRQSADEFRYGVNQAKELYGRVPWWAKAITAAAGPAGLALVITGELGFDLLGGAAGLVAADAETFGRLAEGRFEEAAKGHVASRIGMATNLLPASLVMLGGKGAEWLENKGVPPGLIPRDLQAMRYGAMWIEQFQAFGKRLDQKQYERGAAAAPLVDEILMLPLNFIPGGRAAAQGAKMGARAVAKPVAKAAVEVAEQVAKKELGWVARTLPRVNAVADWAIHGQLSKVSTRAHDWTARQANRLGFNVCFAAETPMRTALGAVRADRVLVGMKLLSRNEYDPDGPVEEMLVEEVFVREGLICLLKAMGQTIRSTSEHPFYVEGKGWTPLNQIHAGDNIWTEASGWVKVEAVEETGQWETVYNFRIAQHHTYFVGGDDWGFSVWSHNQNGCTRISAKRLNHLFETEFTTVESVSVAALKAKNHSHDVITRIRREAYNRKLITHEDFYGSGKRGVAAKDGIDFHETAAASRRGEPEFVIVDGKLRDANGNPVMVPYRVDPATGIQRPSANPRAPSTHSPELDAVYHGKKRVIISDKPWNPDWDNVPNYWVKYKQQAISELTAYREVYGSLPDMYAFSLYNPQTKTWAKSLLVQPSKIAPWLK